MKLLFFQLVLLGFGLVSAQEAGWFTRAINWVSDVGTSVTTAVGSSVNGFVEGVTGEYDEPPYDVIETLEGYEIRRYQPKRWVCTSKKTYGTIPAPGTTQRRMSRSMFMTLFDYISGGNDKEAKIPMTVPVTTVRKVEDGNNKITMCFYVGPEFQNDTPNPTNPNVTFEERPELTVAAMTFGGYYWTWMDFQPEAYNLEQSMRGDGKANYDFSYFYGAGYDAPFKFWNRRNEVWFVKTA